MSTLLDRLARNARAQLHDLLRRYGMAEPSPTWREDPQGDPIRVDEPPARAGPLPHSPELAEAFRVLDLPFGRAAAQGQREVEVLPETVPSRPVSQRPRNDSPTPPSSRAS